MGKTKTLALAALATLAIAATAVAQDRARQNRDRPDNDRYYNVCEDGARGARLSCARSQLADLDRRLNVIYQRMLADAQPTDRAERGRKYVSWYSQADALRNAQRAWIAMRDSDCHFVTQPDPGRRRALELATTLCQADRTSDRVAQLQDMQGQLQRSYDRAAAG